MFCFYDCKRFENYIHNLLLSVIREQPFVIFLHVHISLCSFLLYNLKISLLQLPILPYCNFVSLDFYFLPLIFMPFMIWVIYFALSLSILLYFSTSSINVFSKFSYHTIYISSGINTRPLLFYLYSG